MKSQWCVALGIAVAGILPAQSFDRTATIVGGGSRNGGRCTAEVYVDGAAQIVIRGNRATLINQQGQAPQWRRFECTSPMPRDVRGLSFRALGGRGRQQLVRDPRDGGDAVVEINDSDGGGSNYAFELAWGFAGGPGGGPGYPPPGPGYGRGPGRFTTDQAIRVCQDYVRDQAAERFRTNDIRFRDTNIDNNPGRNDWVLGTIEVRRPRQRDRLMNFSCSVDFSTGRVRSAKIDPR